MAAALRLFGAALVLLALVVPDLASAFTRATDSTDHQAKSGSADPRWFYDDEDGGACDADESREELIDCGAELDERLDEPLVIALLRVTEVRTTKQQCEELLADIWARQTCSADARDCGKLLPGAPPGPGPKLASSSSSAQSTFAVVGFDTPQARRLGPPIDERLPKPRDLQPPVPPPKLPVV